MTVLCPNDLEPCKGHCHASEHCARWGSYSYTLFTAPEPSYEPLRASQSVTFGDRSLDAEDRRAMDAIEGRKDDPIFYGF